MYINPAIGVEKFIHSPTNMNMFRQCPFKFKEYILGRLPFKPSKQKDRGIKVHDTIEDMVRHGVKDVHYFPSGVNVHWVRDMVFELRQASLAGSIYIEEDLCVTESFTRTTWKADDCWLRARADTLVVYPDSVHIIDYKTGKKWDTDFFQLSIEALLAHVIYKKPKIEFEYWYVDQGEAVGDIIDFSNGINKVDHVVSTIKEMKEAFKNNIFLAKANRFCKWCEIKDKCEVL